MIPIDSHARGEDHLPIRDITIGELLAETARAVPDRVAVIASASGQSWTYAEIHDHSRWAANQLAGRFDAGERIAIWANNVPEWIIAEFACAIAGLVIVTVNPAFTAQEARYVLAQSGASCVLAVRDYRGVDLMELARGLQCDCPALREVIDIVDFASRLAATDDGSPHGRARPDDAVMIQYTSGTTGRPKGAVLHHRGLVNNGHHTLQRMGVRDGDVIMTVMPLFHTAGSVLCVLGAVANRATQVLVPGFEPGHVLDVIETHRVTTVLAVPTMLHALVEHHTFDTRDLTSIRVVGSGGAAVPPILIRKIEDKLRVPFVVVMGQTEASPVSAMTEPGDNDVDRETTIGTAMPGVELKIIDPDTGDTVPAHVAGEYCSRGYHVMQGYFDMPEETATTIDDAGWLHSGDLCSMDERGYCTVVGRLRDMIIRGGENVYPREIEERLGEHPSVGEAVVVGLPDDHWGEVVAVFVRSSLGNAATIGELRPWVRETLAAHKTPQQWFSVDTFPMTTSGKIQKFKLVEIWRSGLAQELPA
ncbi:MAG: AMP-binding protein [Ilumatobacteraceae bacterium]